MRDEEFLFGGDILEIATFLERCLSTKFLFWYNSFQPWWEVCWWEGGGRICKGSFHGQHVLGVEHTCALQGGVGGDKCCRTALPSLVPDSRQCRPDWVHLSRRPIRWGESGLHKHQQDIWALHDTRDEHSAGKDANLPDGKKRLLLFFPRRPDLCPSFSFWRAESQLYNICGFLHQLWERDRSYLLISSISFYPLILLSTTGIFPPFFASESNKSHITGLSVNNGTRIEIKDKMDPIRISFRHSEQEVSTI